MRSCALTGEVNPLRPSSLLLPAERRLSALLLQRVTLVPGESKQVVFSLDERAFRLMNENLEWVVEPGDFVLHAGFSSTDIRESIRVTLK